MSLAALRPLAFGEVLDQAFGLFRRAFVPLLTISVVCSGIPALISIDVQAQGGVIQAPILYLVALVFSVIGGAVATGASTFVVSEQYLGQNLEAGEALRRAWGRVGTIIATSMVVGILVFLGFLLLIVPGVIAVAGLSLAVTAVAVEGVDSEQGRARSWELTKDHRWRMLGLLIIYALIAGIAVMAVGVVGGVLAYVLGGGAAEGAAAAGSKVALVGSALGSLIMLAVNPLMYCILVVAYYDLRVRKEAFDLDLLATTLEQAAVRRQG